MPSANLNKLITAIYMWMIKFGFWFLDKIIRVNSKIRMPQEMSDDLKKEVVFPLLLVVALIIGLWVANDCSFSLPYYAP